MFSDLTCDQSRTVRELVKQFVRLGGRFIFTGPHPSLAWMRPHELPFFFNGEDPTYQSTVDTTLEGQISRRDGTSFLVRAIHKNFFEHNRLLPEAGIKTLPNHDEL